MEKRTQGGMVGLRVNLRCRYQNASSSTFFFSRRDEEKEIKEGKESNLFPQRRAGAFRSQTMGWWKSALPLMAPGSTAAAWRQFARLDKWLQGKIAPTCRVTPTSVCKIPTCSGGSFAHFQTSLRFFFFSSCC